MSKSVSLLLFLLLLQNTSIKAQKPTDFLPDKPDKFIFDNHLHKCKLAYYKVKHVIDSINYEKMLQAGLKWTLILIAGIVHYRLQSYNTCHGNTGPKPKKNLKNSNHVTMGCRILWDCFLIVFRLKKWGF